MFGEIKTEPRMNYQDIFAGFCVAVGFLLFLSVLHILAIESTGNTADVLDTIFIIGLRVYITMIIIGFSFIIIHFLKWLVWSVSTPAWKKNEMRNNK